MRSRLLHVIPTLERGGAEKQLVLLATALPKEEFDVHICALTRGGQLEAPLRTAGIPITILGKRWKADPIAWWQLRRHIKGLRPDIVQSWLFTANAYARTAGRSAGVRRLVASERCVDSWKSERELFVDRRLARFTDAIICNSRGVRQFYLAQGIEPAKLRVIYNGIGPALPSSATRAQLLEELGLPPNSRIIGAVGRLWPQKRVKDLIWAADLIKVIRDDVHLVILGDGPQRRALENYRELCHIEDKVHFLGARDDVARWMPHFDLLWLASGFEGLPNVVMEAMAAGIPVVASDIPGTNELVVNGETGFLVPLGDRAGLARWANKILDDSALAARLGAAGRQRIGQEFTLGAMVEKHAALYRELMG